jgi:hypothetical protein
VGPTAIVIVVIVVIIVVVNDVDEAEHVVIQRMSPVLANHHKAASFFKRDLDAMPRGKSRRCWRCCRRCSDEERTSRITGRGGCGWPN